jgi:hypothetical protein
MEMENQIDLFKTELNKINNNLNNLNKTYIVKIIEEYSIKSIFPNMFKML